MLKKITAYLRQKQPVAQPVQPSGTLSQSVILSSKQHVIEQKSLSRQLLHVLRGLHKAGYEAYFVGGGVRDLLLKHKPKDFDVATNARPEQVRAVFSNCRLIGRRFRLAHVFFGREIIEVATFRAGSNAMSSTQISESGRLLMDNVYGSKDDDALRRDFTINAFYFDIRNMSLHSYHGGFEDLCAGQLRLIGEPSLRYREDPVRIIRAVRFAAKLNFTLEKDTAQAIATSKHLLKEVPSVRLFEEVIKLFHTGHAQSSLKYLEQSALLGDLFPATAACLKQEDVSVEKFIMLALQSTDKRIRAGRSAQPAFLLAVLLWFPFQVALEKVKHQQRSSFELNTLLAREVLQEQNEVFNIPKRFLEMIVNIWKLQLNFRRKTKTRSHRLMKHPQFRAAYDFMCLREAVGQGENLSDYWQTYYVASQSQQQAVLYKKKKKRPVSAKKETE